jgi:ABC-type multidrug transport system permease subunit
MELPGWLRVAARINPVTYGVDALKHFLIDPTNTSRWTPDFALGTDLVVLFSFAVVAVSASVALFRLREV